jgi:tetratricopeptide (TPR) repeat protein
MKKRSCVALRGLRGWGAALIASASLACAPGGAEESAVRRGDEAFARDSLEEALAEYRLAVRQGAEDPEILSRVAHTYVALGRLEEATEFFARAAARDPRWGDMGVSDLVRAARGAAERNDRFQMASAMEAVRRLRPGLSVPDLTLPLARHYLQVGEYGRSIPLFQRALDDTGEPSPELLYEVGEAHREVDDCRSALIFFDRYQEVAPQADRFRANWNIGDCSLRVARTLRERSATTSDLEEALVYVTRSLDVGEPRSLQGQAWFDRAEILSSLGDCTGALESFAQVRFYESANSPIVARAERRIEEVTIGRGLVQIRGRCG